MPNRVRIKLCCIAEIVPSIPAGVSTILLTSRVEPEAIVEQQHRCRASTVRPFGVDVCSGVRSDGRLDESKLAAFVRAVRGTATAVVAAVAIAAAVLARPGSVASAQAPELASAAGVHLDHVSIAVHDLEAAARTFRDRLGFSLKPGRTHENTVENVHVKFADGSALELITATEPSDPVAGGYVEFLRGGEGAAFVALRTTGIAALARSLARPAAANPPPAGPAFGPARIVRGPYYEWLVFPDAHPLHYLFFTSLTRPPIDHPEHLSHANGARSLRGVWIAGADHHAELELAGRLGLSPPVTTGPPASTAGITVVELDTGHLYLVQAAGKHRDSDPSGGTAGAPGQVSDVASGRPLVGVTVDVTSLDAVVRSLDPEVLRRAIRGADPRGAWLRIPPALAHGIRLELLDPGGPG